MPAIRRAPLLLLLAAVLALPLARGAAAQGPAAPPAPDSRATSLPLTDPMPVDSAIIRAQLPNGLRYYVRSNPKPEKRAELRLVVKAGSILEEDDQQGLAH